MLKNSPSITEFDELTIFSTPGESKGGLYERTVEYRDIGTELQNSFEGAISRLPH